MAVVRKRVVMHGRVQGVFFRDSTRRLAEQHGVTGWVRNTREGTVEAVFEGSPTEVERLVAYCRRGPDGAEVSQVDTQDEEPEGLSGFSIR